VLFDAKGQCVRDSETLTSELKISVAGSAFAKGTFGVYVSGHLAPTPKIDESYVYFKAEAGGMYEYSRVEFGMSANVFYEKREIARVASIPLTPFQIPGVGSIGPLLELDVDYDARFSMHGAFKAAVNVNMPPIHVAYGDKNADPKTSEATTAQSSDATGSAISNVVQPSLQVDFQAEGSVDLFVIPKATLDIDLLSEFLDAQVGLSAQAGLTGKLSAGASAGTGQNATAEAYLGLEASANANLFAQGTAFWTKTATSSVSLYSLSGVLLFQKCFNNNNNNNNGAGNTANNGSQPGGSNATQSVTPGPLVPAPEVDGSTAAARVRRRSLPLKSMDMPGYLKRRLLSRSSAVLQKRAAPLFSISVDLCPAKGNGGGQDPVCTLIRRNWEDDALPTAQIAGNHTIKRRRLIIAPGTVLTNTTFFDKLLNFVSNERGLWPTLDKPPVGQVPDTVVFNSLAINPQRFPTSLHHIMDIRIIRKIFNTLVFQKVGGTWRIMCPSFLDSLGELVDRRALIPETGPLPVERFKAFLRTLNFGPANMETAMKVELGPTHDVFDLYTDKMASWIPFNLFVGPQGQFRGDDPGNEFEANARCLSWFRCNVEVYPRPA
ncbi:hypothetical protein HK102_002332, partial [Quaeritorhiza haematococci]